MAKTLDQIINRNDYIRLNSSLIDRAIEVAHIIRKKMQDLDEEELAVNISKPNECSVHIRSVRANGFSTEYLGIDKYDHGEYISCHSLECNKSFYYAGDFNCWIQRASSEEFLLFLKNARDLLNALDELESEKVNKINKVMESTKDIKIA